MAKLYPTICDLFGDASTLPATSPIPGSMDLRLQVSHQFAELLRECPMDRYEVAAQASRLTGRDVSKNMLDAYASPGRDDHNLPLALVPVIEVVTSTARMTEWLATQRGGRFCAGAEVLEAELGKLEALKGSIERRAKDLRARLAGGVR